MRHISLGLAALAIVLAGSLTSVAYASTESLHAAQRADRENGALIKTARDAMVADAVAGTYDGADKFRDATGHPLPGWQNVVYSANS
jgi:hypothetical protein